MKLYRIAKTAYIDDSTGAGARRFGGRWNEKGTSLIYASESRSLAALEFLVHVPVMLVPKDLSICVFDLPDDISVERIRQATLPADWRMAPAPISTTFIGTAWAAKGETLILAVPSVIVPEENNFLINSQHPRFKRIKRRIESFRFDGRLKSKPGEST